MNPELQALGRRAVACKGWRWLPGMVWCLPSSAPGPMKGRMIGDDPSGLLLSVGWPDFSDPATLGCVLALVREAWSEPLGSVYYLVTMVEEPGWYAEFGDSEELYDTEAEALVAALEAASL